MVNEMQIEMIQVSDLTPYDHNPRKNDASVEYVANSIKEFGFKIPIVVDRNNVVVCGHTRLKAAKKLKMKSIPCIRADDLSDKQIQAFRLADNKVGERSEWDYNELGGELDDLLPDFKMEDFGFDLGTDDEFGTDFDLASGDKTTSSTMSFSLSQDQADIIKDAIGKMKGTERYKNYQNDNNGNSNGNALFLVVDEWLQQQTSD